MPFSFAYMGFTIIRVPKPLRGKGRYIAVHDDQLWRSYAGSKRAVMRAIRQSLKARMESRKRYLEYHADEISGK